MTSIRSSGPSRLIGLAGPTSECLNWMDLPCSPRSLWLHAGGKNPGSTADRSRWRGPQFCLPLWGTGSATPITIDFGAMFPFTGIPAYNLPVYASQRPSPDATQDSVRGCSLGFAAAAISGSRARRACKAQTGSPEAVARLRFPQNVACGFPAPRSSAVASQLWLLFAQVLFHGRRIFSLHRRPYLPLNGAHVAQEQFNDR